MSSNPTERILIVAIEQAGSLLLEQVLRSSGFDVVTIREPDSAEQMIDTIAPAVVILGESIIEDKDLERASHLRERFPTIPLLFLANQDSPSLLKSALHIGLTNYICLPANPEDILSAVQFCLAQYHKWKDWQSQVVKQASLALQDQVHELEIEKTQLNLKLSKQESILSGLLEGVIVIDESGCIILINDVAKHALNLVETDVTGQPALKAFTQTELQELIKSSNTPPNRGVEINVEDGRTFNGVIGTIPGVGWAISLADVTSFKRLDRIKSEFVGTVSHDLRSPLTSILGYVELIDRVGPVNETQREFIHRVQASVHNITSLVDDLLNLGRIEAGVDTRKELIHLSQIINLSVGHYAGRAVDKTIDLIMETPEKLPLFYGNPVQIRQVIDNLLDNAIKYTPAGGEVHFQARVEQDQIIIQISDNGIGIPATDLPYIFDKFYRASNVSIETGGTGLGLAIVKTVIENHDGRVWVDSNPGRGSKFTIVLPVASK